jgi:hypothetical protein
VENWKEWNLSINEYKSFKMIKLHLPHKADYIDYMIREGLRNSKDVLSSGISSDVSMQGMTPMN